MGVRAVGLADQSACYLRRSFPEFLVRNRIDTVFANPSCQPYEAMAVSGAIDEVNRTARRGSPVALWVRNELASFTRPTIDYYPLDSWTQGYTTVSRLDREFLLKRFPDLKKSQVHSRFYAGVDLDKFDPDKVESGALRAELGIEGNSTLMVTIGRLSPEKGHSFLFRALPQVFSEFSSARLIVIGSGGLEKAIRGFLSEWEYGGRVTLLGFRRDLPQILQDCDILLHPSLDEGFSRVVMEAMAMAKPVVATDVGGTREAMRGPYAPFLIPPARPADLRDALLTLLRDEELRAKVGKEGRRIARRLFDSRRRARFVMRFSEREVSRLSLIAERKKPTSQSEDGPTVAFLLEYAHPILIDILISLAHCLRKKRTRLLVLALQPGTTGQKRRLDEARIDFFEYKGAHSPKKHPFVWLKQIVAQKGIHVLVGHRCTEHLRNMSFYMGKTSPRICLYALQAGDLTEEIDSSIEFVVSGSEIALAFAEARFGTALTPLSTESLELDDLVAYHRSLRRILFGRLQLDPERPTVTIALDSQGFEWTPVWIDVAEAMLDFESRPNLIFYSGPQSPQGAARAAHRIRSLHQDRVAMVDHSVRYHADIMGLADVVLAQAGSKASEFLLGSEFGSEAQLISVDASSSKSVTLGDDAAPLPPDKNDILKQVLQGLRSSSLEMNSLEADLHQQSQPRGSRIKQVAESWAPLLKSILSSSKMPGVNVPVFPGEIDIFLDSAIEGKYLRMPDRTFTALIHQLSSCLDTRVVNFRLEGTSVGLECAAERARYLASQVPWAELNLILDAGCLRSDNSGAEGVLTVWNSIAVIYPSASSLVSGLSSHSRSELEQLFFDVCRMLLNPRVRRKATLTVPRYVTPEAEVFLAFWKESGVRVRPRYWETVGSPPRLSPHGFIRACEYLVTRMFVYADGSIRPCDLPMSPDLKQRRVPPERLQAIWLGDSYSKLRSLHACGRRNELPACSACPAWL